METIEEGEEGKEPTVNRSRRGKGSKKKVKHPYRYLPHLVVDLPEIWWQQLPFEKQAELRKKARNLGYRPPTKKRLTEADKKVRLLLEEIDQHVSENHASASNS